MKHISIQIILIMVALSLSFYFIVAAPANEGALQNAKPSSMAQDEENEDLHLGDGAFADWAADGIGELDAQGSSPIATLYIQGRVNQDMWVSVLLQARIGTLIKTIYEDDVFVGRLESVFIPIDWSPALNLHIKQMLYATKIRGQVSVIPQKEGEVPYTEILKNRFLIMHPESQKVEVYDFPNLKMDYPYGITSADEWQKLEANGVFNDREGSVLGWVGAGQTTSTESKIVK